MNDQRWRFLEEPARRAAFEDLPDGVVTDRLDR